MSPIRLTRLINYSMLPSSTSSQSNTSFNANMPAPSQQQTQPAGASAVVAGSALLDAETRLFQTGYPGRRTDDSVYHQQQQQQQQQQYGGDRMMKWDSRNKSPRRDNDSDISDVMVREKGDVTKQSSILGRRRTSRDRGYNEDYKTASAGPAGPAAASKTTTEKTTSDADTEWTVDERSIWELLEPRPIEEMVARPIQRRRDQPDTPEEQR